MRSFGLRAKLKKFQNILLSLVLLAAQALPLISFPQTAQAAQLCTVDSSGANDEPGQKDLTQMCVDYANTPTTINVIWNWDALGSSGANTLDGCSLFDTDNDGNVDYAVCVTTTGNPAVLNARTTYSCGDTKADRCTSTSAVVASGSTVCTITQPATGDPFPTGDSYPKDTVANCVIDLSTVGGSSAKLVDACSFPSGQPGSDPSDCILARAKAGKLEVIKSLVPVNDPGLFDLQIDSSTKATNVSNGGTTGEFVVSEGNHSVGELAGTNTNLSGYTSGIVCKNLNGTGTTVASGSGTNLATVPVADGSDIVCTITNTRLNGNLTVVKNLIKDNGGTASVTDFGFQVDGGTAIPFEGDASNTISYPSGTVITSVTEPAVAGYATSYSNCSNLTIVAGQTQTCTITNNDIAPTLTLVKTVTNNNGGGKTAVDFQAKIDGSNVSWSTAVPVSAGGHTASEVGLSTYSAGSWGGDCAADGSITLVLDQDATCTITNDDKAPSLTVRKVAINDNGGTYESGEFTLYVNATAFTGGTSTVDPSDSTKTSTSYEATVSKGVYTLSEDAETGYTASDWDCEGNATPIDDDEITIELGESITCTITNNDDTPALTLIKNLVDNYNSGAASTEWILTATGSTTISGTTGITSDSGFDAGSYELSESGPGAPGFINGNWDCGTADLTDTTLLVYLGDNITCTVTNTSVQPRVKVIKHVVDNYGGSKSASDFEMTVVGTDVTMTAGNDNLDSSQSFPGDENGTYVYLDAGTYDVSEGAHDGYESSQSGDCDDEIAVGEEKTCTITNTAIQPKLTLVKYAGKYYDGNLNDFGLTINGDAVSSGVANGLNVGSYTINENGKSGYRFVEITGDEECPSELGGTVNLELGDDITCTIHNEELGHVVVTKYNDQDRDGYFDESESALPDWTIKLDDIEQVTDENGETTFENVLPGYSSLSEVQKDGWNQSNIFCYIDDVPAGVIEDGYQVKVYSGETTECYIGNFKDPELNVAKSNNSGASKLPGEVVTYSITLSNDADGSYLYNPTVSDTPPTGFGYEAGSWTADSNLRGDLKLAGVVLEPNFGVSPVVWTFDGAGSSEDVVKPGETITLTYQMKIASNVGAGTYTNFATSSACGVGQVVDQSIYRELLSIAIIDRDCVTSDKVRSDVKVVVKELAKTGASSLLAPLFGLVLVAGAILASRPKSTTRSK